MAEVTLKYNNFCGTLGEVILPKGKHKEPYIQVDKSLFYNFAPYKYGSIAKDILVQIIDYCKNPKNKNTNMCWNKARIRAFFKNMNLSYYVIDKIFIIYEKLGYLRHEKIYPHAGCNRIIHKYTFFANPELNPFYKQDNTMDISTEELLTEVKESINNSENIIKEEVIKKKKPKKENNDLDYTEKIEYDNTSDSAIILSKRLYDKTAFNQLTKENYMFDINSRNDSIINYKNVVNEQIGLNLLKTTDTNYLAEEGFNIMLKGMMNYSDDLEDNIKHANNLVNKFSTYESTKSCIDSLWKFRNYNRLFTKDFNITLNDNNEIDITKSTVLYPSDTNKEHSDDILYILNDASDTRLTQNELKNKYFINFCFLIGAYLYHCNNISIKEENKLYSNNFISYQDINAFTKIFERYPYLIYLPIDETSMNLLGELHNKHQEEFKNN